MVEPSTIAQRGWQSRQSALHSPTLLYPVSVECDSATSFCSAIVGALACSSEPGAPTQPTHEIIQGIPPGWSGVVNANFGVGIDRTARRSGNSALFLSVTAPVANAGAYVSQSIRAERFRGKRVRLSAWVTHFNASGPAIGLWMRIDAPGFTAAFDDMHGRSVTGTRQDWHEISVVLDVAKNAERIAFGSAVEGQGNLYVDDMRLEEVGLGVASTNMYTQPQPANTDSAGLAFSAAQLREEPTNLDFESRYEPSGTAVSWVAQHATPLTTSDPSVSLSDLSSLKAMVGDAHIVGLGEATHGTREFFRMKHRMLQLLVSEMGFTRFAIEATSPEANDVNRYVLTGEGNPRVALSRLYFWTWNTQEVLDMIEWMRGWNSRASPSRQVQFLGFDMQHPGTAMDSVLSYVQRIDPPNTWVTERYMCLHGFRNLGETPGLAMAFYGGRTADSSKAKCARGLQDVSDTLRLKRAAYVARSSAAEYELCLHDARLVQQYEATASVAANGVAGPRERDRYMAENVQWIRDQAPPGTKIVLWAHNGHIARTPLTMGEHLHAKYGADYVSLGFAFGAAPSTRSARAGCAVGRPWRYPAIHSRPFFRRRTGSRRCSTCGQSHQVATRPRNCGNRFRSEWWDRVFDPANELAYYSPFRFPETFDLMVYIENTSASVLLPFVYR